MKSVIASLGRHLSANKVESLSLRPAPHASDRETKKRTVLILVANGTEPFIGKIGDIIDSIGIDYNVWLIESLNPLVALSAELDPRLINFQALATACRNQNCRFIAAHGVVEFGIVGEGARMSYGSVTPLWSKLISAAFRLHGSDSWISEELGAEADSTGSEWRDVDGARFCRMVTDKTSK